MRVIVTSPSNLNDQECVIEALAILPVSTTVLLPSRSGACKIVIDNIQLLKLEIEDWSTDDDDYDIHGSTINTKMINSDVDMCIAFVNNKAYSTKDCIRQARANDLDVNVINI